MIAFEILVNGHHIQTLTVGEFGMLAADLMWLKLPLPDGATDDEIRLMPTGSEGVAGDSVSWQEFCLNVGDTMTIRIVETDWPGDDPTGRKTLAEMNEERRKRGK